MGQTLNLSLYDLNGANTPCSRSNPPFFISYRDSREQDMPICQDNSKRKRIVHYIRRRPGAYKISTKHTLTNYLLHISGKMHLPL